MSEFTNFSIFWPFHNRGIREANKTEGYIWFMVYISINLVKSNVRVLCLNSLDKMGFICGIVQRPQCKYFGGTVQLQSATFTNEESLIYYTSNCFTYTHPIWTHFYNYRNAINYLTISLFLFPLLSLKSNFCYMLLQFTDWEKNKKIQLRCIFL